MKIHNLPGDPGRKQGRKRLGRGHGSGHGKTAGMGHKGQQARSGAPKAGAFEGGQMPLTRRLPKGGFKNPFRVEYEVVNLASLEKMFEAGATVDPESLAKLRLVQSRKPVKILATGTLTKALTIKAHKASEAAIARIKESGGTFEAING